jgi:drug/metabolite transporter (DMT)-like permease
MGPQAWATAASLGALILIWGTTWAAIRIGLEGIPPFAGVAMRFGLAGALLVAWGARRGSVWPRDRRAAALAALNTVCTFLVPYVLVYWAEQWVPSGLVAVLFATFPLFVALLAHPFLPEERLTVRTVLGTLLGLLGVATIFSEELTALGGPQVRFVSLVFLFSPLVSAAANVAIRRWGRDVHPLALTGPPMLATGVVAGGLSLCLERGRPLILDLPSIASVVYLAVLGSALTFVLYFRLLARLPATRLALIAFAIPVVAVLVGAVLFEERLTGRVGLGAALVLGGVAVTLSRSGR